jgi:hypothetical protein
MARHEHQEGAAADLLACIVVRSTKVENDSMRVAETA